MRFIHNNNLTDPHLNLALEEYCLRNLDITEDYVLFYINALSVIIGKHQNPFEECNVEYLQNKNIHLVRRISGGGTVYHDHGNLNFSFITGFEKEKLDYFQKLIQPILRALRQLGVHAADLGEQGRGQAQQGRQDDRRRPPADSRPPEGEQRDQDAADDHPQLHQQARLLVEPGADVVEVGLFLIIERFPGLRRIPGKVVLAPAGFLAEYVEAAERRNADPSIEPGLSA